MLYIECPTPAYKRIADSGLEVKIIQSKDKISSLLLGMSDIPIGEKSFQKIFKKAERILQKEGKISEITELYKDLLIFRNLAEEMDEFLGDKEELIMKNPTFLAYLAIEEDILNFKEYGFSSRKQLEESIASYCIGEKIDLDLWRYDYIWRNSDMKNTLSHGEHGDFFASQTDVSGKERKIKTMFGEEIIFDTQKDCSGLGKSMGGHDGNWQEFLTIILKYAEFLGKSNMWHITNWEDVLQYVGAVGTNTTEAMFGDGTRDYQIELMMESPLLVNGKEINSYPINIYGGDNTHYIPYVCEGKLLFMLEDNKGDIKLPFKEEIFADKNYTTIITYEENDLLDLLKGTYKLFARDRSNLPRIINKFLEQKLPA